jgi:hypothetical protein
MKRNTFVGILSQYNVERDFGIAMVEGHKRSYSFSRTDGPYRVIIDENEELVFGEKTDDPNPPGVSDYVMIQISGGRVIAWAHKEEWDAAEPSSRKGKSSAQVQKFMARLEKQRTLKSKPQTVFSSKAVMSPAVA